MTPYSYSLGFTDSVEDADVFLSKEEAIVIREGMKNGMRVVMGIDGCPALIPVDKRTYKEQEDSMRELRDDLLIQSDWSQLSDVPDHLKEKYRGYRQDLRDITKTKGWPFNIEWPTVD